MPALFVLLNHDLTEMQLEEAKSSFKIETIRRLPPLLHEIWSRIPVNGELDTSMLERFTEWIDEDAEVGDYVLIQGEFGATFYLVDYCFATGFIPIYAASPRDSMESRNGDGTVERKLIFSHVNFRRYRKYEKTVLS